MKKRLRKKIHRNYLDEVVELSQLSFWRKLLFEAKFGEKFAIDSKTTEGIPEELQKLLRRYQLSYYISKVPHEQATEWRGWEDFVLFKVEASEFPSVCSVCANNPEIV
jgi:hypothetical protein